jgi:hypothetical protein
MDPDNQYKEGRITITTIEIIQEKEKRLREGSNIENKFDIILITKKNQKKQT